MRGHATVGVLVLFIAERASRQSQWHLGEVGLDRDALGGEVAARGGGAAHGGRHGASPAGRGRVASEGEAS
jgi:hypothetical protein